MSLPFTLVIPGQGPISSFQCANDIYHLDIANPIKVPSLCLTLNQPLPNDQLAVTLYYTVPPYLELEYMGFICNSKPSEIFQTGFNLKKQLVNQTQIKICIKGEPLLFAQNQQIKSDGKKQYTKLVAQNLYNYMMSYNKSDLLVNGTVGDYMVIPANFLDRWLQKFQNRYRLDPDFILKSTEN